MRRSSAAAKSHNTQVKNAAIRIESVLATITSFDEAVTKIPDAFKAERIGLRGDAFWVLDNDHRTAGHSWLRQIRNHSEHGPALFRLFTKEPT